MDFLAIDFETPNKRNDSICALGITLVKNSVVEFNRLILINPHAQFDEMNISIHGITKASVKDAPDFSEVWREYELYFRHYPLVAHNATFEKGVLQKAAKRCGIQLPKLDYYCTMRLYEENFGLHQCSLDKLCEKYDIALEHHNASSDSLAAAQLMLLLSQNEEAALHTLDCGEAAYIAPQKPKEDFYRLHPSSPENLVQPECCYADDAELHVPYHVFCFTGEIPGISRGDAQNYILQHGGNVTSSVSRRTHYLIVGQEDSSIVGGAGGKSSKILKAEELAAQGAIVKIIRCEKFIELFNAQNADE